MRQPKLFNDDKTPRIRVTVKGDRFRQYLWLKYVNAFDPSQHCAKCLIGSFSTALRFGVHKGAGDVYDIALTEHKARFMYLCGVTNVWADNLHVAMRPKAGERWTIETPDATVEGWNVERLPITPIPADAAPEFTARGPEFLTCRNYQFGYAYLGAADLDAGLTENARVTVTIDGHVWQGTIISKGLDRDGRAAVLTADGKLKIASREQMLPAV